MKLNDGCHLTYCTNVHPGQDWQEHFTEIKKHLPAIKQTVAPDKRFGIGLRLSALAAKQLLETDNFRQFTTYLNENDLYVFTLNGFPYAAFHNTPVKEKVYLPDWRMRERLEYSNDLACLLTRLSPDQELGSISTVPIGFKPDINWGNDSEIIITHLLEHIAYLHRLYLDTGKPIILALEPEPACFLETIQETIDFFVKIIRSMPVIEKFSKIISIDSEQALIILNRHLGICLDLCHAAVEYEDSGEIIQQLKENNIEIAKIQISAGLKLDPRREIVIEALKEYDEPIYLHQTIAQYSTGLQRFVDLSGAMQNATDALEWRTHFHVPVFIPTFGLFDSTQAFTQEILKQHKKQKITSHLEVETYTWNVLPKTLKLNSLSDAIAQEINWCLEQLSV